MRTSVFHIIPMAGETARTADPIAVLGFMAMPTARTLATSSSFRASEAQDVSRFGLVGQVRDVFAIFPQCHTLIVMPAAITIAYAMWVADEQCSYDEVDVYCQLW
jgi:hypothetical protein